MAEITQIEVKIPKTQWVAVIWAKGGLNSGCTFRSDKEGSVVITHSYVSAWLRTEDQHLMTELPAFAEKLRQVAKSGGLFDPRKIPLKELPFRRQKD